MDDDQADYTRLVKAPVAKVTITAPDRLIPVFRIPQPRQKRR
jgi:hypothetical protein